MCRQPRASSPWLLHGKIDPSADGHHLVHADGTPFFWVGDTAWALHQNLGQADVIRYLDSALECSFNVVQLMTANQWALDGQQRNYFGDKPFVNDDVTRLNPGFWDYLGWVIDQAAERGIYVALVFGQPGRKDQSPLPTADTPVQAYDYGRAIGNHLMDRPNLIWASGIDMAPDDPVLVSDMGMEGWHAMAEGVADATTRLSSCNGSGSCGAVLMSYHPPGGPPGKDTSSTWFHDSPWLDFNMGQLDPEAIVPRVAADYNRIPAKPIINGEPWYEHSTWQASPVSDWDVRHQAYSSVLSGAFGHTYGNQYVCHFDSPGVSQHAGQWKEHLDDPGRDDMRHLAAAMEPRLTPDRIPDQSLITEGQSTGISTRDRITATRAKYGSFALIYSPRGSAFAVDMDSLRGREVIARWFDTREGEYQNIGSLPAAGESEFEPPGSPGEGNDWLLVLEAIDSGASPCMEK